MSVLEIISILSLNCKKKLFLVGPFPEITHLQLPCLGSRSISSLYVRWTKSETLLNGIKYRNGVTYIGPPYEYVAGVNAQRHVHTCGYSRTFNERDRKDVYKSVSMHNFYELLYPLMYQAHERFLCAALTLFECCSRSSGPVTEYRVQTAVSVMQFFQHLNCYSRSVKRAVSQSTNQSVTQSLTKCCRPLPPIAHHSRPRGRCTSC